MPSSIPYQVASIQAPSGKKALIDYQGLLANLPVEHIIWRVKWYKAHYPHLFSENHTFIILIGLYQSTPYVPVRVLCQFTIHQDLFDFTTIYGDVYKLNYKTPHQVWPQLTTLWDSSHTRVLRHLPLVSTKTPKTSSPYDL